VFVEAEEVLRKAAGGVERFKLVEQVAPPCSIESPTSLPLTRG
jgi:hypothetical protein